MDHLSTGWSFVCLKWKANVSGRFKKRSAVFYLLCDWWKIYSKHIRATQLVLNLNSLAVRAWSSLWCLLMEFYEVRINFVQLPQRSHTFLYQISTKALLKVASKASLNANICEFIISSFVIIVVLFISDLSHNRHNLVIWSRKTSRPDWLHHFLHHITSDSVACVDTFSASSICCFHNSW